MIVENKIEKISNVEEKIEDLTLRVNTLQGRLEYAKRNSNSGDIAKKEKALKTLEKLLKKFKSQSKN